MLEKITTLFLLALSIFYVYLANRYAFGTLQSPGPGFLPISAGIIAIVFCIALLCKQWKSSPLISLDKIDWTKFLFIVVGFIFYLAIFKIVGYCLSSFIFLFYLFKIYDTKNGIKRSLICAVSSALIFYVIFVHALHVPLP